MTGGADKGLTQNAGLANRETALMLSVVQRHAGGGSQAETVV
jgi:hypothetical protein